MKTMNTSIERVDELIRQSDRIYEHIDEIVDNEPRYRRLLRLGINSVALALRDGQTYSEAGMQFLILRDDTPPKQGPLDPLANQYADIERATLDLSGKPETDARHALHLVSLSVPYARTYYPDQDTGKIAFYGLLHDIVEAEAKDVSSLGISKEQAAQKHLDEMRAVETLRRKYGDKWPELIKAIDDYEALEETEARYAKTFDKLDPGFTHLYNRGFQLTERYGFTRETFLQAIDQTTIRMATYSQEFPQLMEDRDELTRRVADAAFEKAA